MNIGTLTATLGLDASQATASMSAFQRQMLTSVTQINATLIAMAQKMGVVAVSAENMANRTLAATNKIVVATRTASTGLGTFAQKIVAAEANAASNSLIVSPTGKSSVVAANKKAKEEVDKTPITPVFDPTQAIKNIDAYTTTIFRSAQRWRTVGYLTSIVLTAPLLMVGKAAIQAASDFEFAMKKTIGLAGIAKSAIKGYSDELLKMAISTAQTPKALAEAFYFTTSAGFKNGAEAIKIVDTAAKAATAGMGEASDVAKLLVFSMNAYKQSGVTAAHAADIFTTAVKEGAIEAEGFAASIQSVISIAAPLGVDLETVAGSMAAMSLQGATAARSATYLRGMLNSLLKIKPTNEAGKALAEMGVNVNSLFNTLKEKGGLLKVLIQLQELSKGTTGNQFLKTIFADIRALTGELNLMGENLQYNIGLMDRMYNAQGALGTAVMGVADTIQVQKNRLQATFKVLMTELGKPLSEIILPMLQRLADTLKGLIEWFSGLSKGAQNTIIHILGLVAAIGPLALLASVLKYAYGGLFSFFGKGFLYITSLVKGLKGEIIAMQVAATMMPKLTGILGMTTAGGRVAMAGAKAATAATAATAGATTVGVAGAGIGAGIAGTVSAIPYVALAAAVGIATVAFIKLMRSQGEYDRVQKTAEGQRAQEIITMKGLFDRASDLKNSLEQRKKAIQAINDSYGEYLKNMLDETTSIDNIKNAYKDASNALILYTALKANTEARQEHEAKTNKQFGKSFGDIAVLLQKEKPDMLGDFYTDVYAAADKAINEGNAIIRSRIAKEEFKKIYEKYIGDISKQSLRGVDSLGQFLLASYKFMHIRATEMPFIAQVESLTSKLDKLKNKVQETNEALAVFINFKTPEIKMPEIPKLDGSVLGTFKNLGKGISIASPVKDLNVQLGETKKTLDNVTEKYKAFFTAKGYAFGGNKEMDDFILSTYEAMKALDVEAAAAKRNGNEFNKNQELVSTLSSALDKMKETLGVTNPVYSFFAQILGRAEKALKEQKKELKELNKELEIFKELNASLAANQMRKFIEPNFDKVTADLETYKKAYEDYTKVAGEPTGINIPNRLGIPDKQLSSLLMMIAKAKELKGTLDELTATQQKQADAKMLYVLNAEADAFGGLAGKIEVVNFEMQAIQRNIRRMFETKASNMPIDEKQLQKWINQYKELKTVSVDMQNALEIKRLTDMNNAMHTASTETALWSGKMSALENTLRDLSANNMEGTKVFKDTAKQLQEFETGQRVVENLDNAFDQLFDAILDGGKNMKDVMKNIFKAILADIVKTIAHAMILKAVMKAFEEPPVGHGIGGSPAGQGNAMFSGITTFVNFIKLISTGLPALAKGGVVPLGYLNDTFPAMLTSREFVIPEERLDKILKETPDAKRLKKTLTDQLPKLADGGIIPHGYPNDTFPAMLSSGEAIIPLNKTGGDSALINLLKKLIQVTEVGNDSLLGGLVGIGDTTKNDPVLRNVLQAQANSENAWKMYNENQKIYSDLYTKIKGNAQQTPLTDKGFFKIRDIENGQPGIRNNALVSRQIVADLARATAKEQVPLMKSLSTAMRETGIGSYLGPVVGGKGLSYTKASSTYNPEDIMQSLDAMDVTGLRSYDQWMAKKGRIPSWFTDKQKSGQTFSGDDLKNIDKVFLNLKNVSEYSKYIKNFKFDEGLLEPFRKEVRFLGERGTLGYNAGEKDRAQKIAREEQVIRANPDLYNYADSVYKATQHQQNIAAKGTPAMTGIMTLWTKLLGKKKEEPAPTVFTPTPKPDYTGMGIGFMNNPEKWKAAFYEPNVPKYIGGEPPMVGLGAGKIVAKLLGKLPEKGILTEIFKGGKIEAEAEKVLKQFPFKPKTSKQLYGRIGLEPKRLLKKDEWKLLQDELDKQGILDVQKTPDLPWKKIIHERITPKGYDIETHIREILNRGTSIQTKSLSRAKENLKGIESEYGFLNLTEIEKASANRLETWNMYTGHPQVKGENQLYNISRLSTNKNLVYTINPKRFVNPSYISNELNELSYINSEANAKNFEIGKTLPKNVIERNKVNKSLLLNYERRFPSEEHNMFGTMGGFGWNAKQLPTGNTKFLATDIWDLQPFKNLESATGLPKFMTKSAPEGWESLELKNIFKPLKNLEVGKTLGIGKPLDVKVGFELNPEIGRYIKTFGTTGLVAGGLGITAQANAQEIGKKKTYKEQYLPNDSINKVVSNLMDQRLIGAPWEGKNSKVSINNRALEEQAMKIFKDTYNRTLSKRDMSALQLGRASWTGKIPKESFKVNAEDLMSLNTSLTQATKNYTSLTNATLLFSNATKSTQPVIQAQTNALNIQQKAIKVSNPMIAPVPIPQIPLLAQPNGLLPNGLAPTNNIKKQLDMSLDVNAKADPEVLASSEKSSKMLNQLFNNILQKGLGGVGQTGGNTFFRDIVLSIIPFGGIFKGILGTLFGPTMEMGGMKGIMGAKGGIVPMGYPNDTYPALLTSGERIIPNVNTAQFSEDTFTQKQLVLAGDVRFEIEGSRLVGILKKSERQNTRV